MDGRDSNFEIQGASMLGCVNPTLASRNLCFGVFSPCLFLSASITVMPKSGRALNKSRYPIEPRYGGVQYSAKRWRLSCVNSHPWPERGRTQSRNLALAYLSSTSWTKMFLICSNYYCFALLANVRARARGHITQYLILHTLPLFHISIVLK